MSTRTCRSLNSLLSAVGIVAINIAAAGPTVADDTTKNPISVSNLTARGSAETIYFTDPQQLSVRVVRGDGSSGSLYMRREVLTFGGGSGQRVAVIRGMVEPASISAPPTADKAGPLSRTAIERIDPMHPARSRLAVLRGAAAWRRGNSADLFSFGSKDEFDRIAEAVHGVESRYGTDWRMWRLNDLNGPQGPMQVSAAAAVDVGGGNRFDMYQNILLGRAYLARLFRRYGSWSDTLAAYNWGPGNVDQWIARGRNVEQLPAETVRYTDRVLRQALIGSVAGTEQRHVSKQ